MANPDLRALCADLIAELQGYKTANPMHDRSLLDRARAALAVEAVGPSEDRVATLERELERERLRLAACGVVAMADTPKSAAEARKIHLEYHSGSLDDVIRQIDALMEARAVLARYGSAPRPVPVSERLPGPEDYGPHPRGRTGDWCWGLEHARTSHGLDCVLRLMRPDEIETWASHWLPAHAIPLPQENIDV